MMTKGREWLLGAIFAVAQIDRAPLSLFRKILHSTYILYSTGRTTRIESECSTPGVAIMHSKRCNTALHLEDTLPHAICIPPQVISSRNITLLHCNACGLWIVHVVKIIIHNDLESLENTRQLEEQFGASGKQGVQSGDLYSHWPVQTFLYSHLFC